MGASLALAVTVVVIATFVGRGGIGLGLAVGLLIGAFNGITLQTVLDRRAPILATSVLRLSLFSLVALITARLIGAPVWTVVLGVGVAQLVMVGVGVRQGLRA